MESSGVSSSEDDTYVAQKDQQSIFSGGILECAAVFIDTNLNLFYQCKMCKKNITDQNLFVIHQREHLKHVPISCHVCTDVFASLPEYFEHMKFCCGSLMEKLEDLCNPFLQNQNETALQALAYPCESTESMSHILNPHIGSHTEYDPFKCILCDSTFCDSRSLRRHHLTHSRDYKWLCDICGLFIFKSKFVTHQRVHHNIVLPQPRPHKCGKCGKGFTAKCRRDDHEFVHLKARSFECDACGETFKQKQGLRRHVLLSHK